MQTVADPTLACKPAKAFYAHPYDQAGALAKLLGWPCRRGEVGADDCHTAA